MKTLPVTSCLFWTGVLILSCHAQITDRRETTVTRADIMGHKGNGQQEPFAPGHFNETPPGEIPKAFAPGIVSSKSNYEFKIALAPDGKEIDFTRGIGDGSRERQIFCARLTSNGWTQPEPAPFCERNHLDEYPAISPDGKKLFVGSNRPLPVSWNRKTASYIFNLWVVERTGDGWGKPYPVNPEANRGICIHYIDNPGAICSNTHSSRIAKAECNNGLFTKPVEIRSPVPATECFFAPDHRPVVYSSSHPGFGRLDPLVSFISHDGAWESR